MILVFIAWITGLTVVAWAVFWSGKNFRRTPFADGFSSADTENPDLPVESNRHSFGQDQPNRPGKFRPGPNRSDPDVHRETAMRKAPVIGWVAREVAARLTGRSGKTTATLSEDQQVRRSLSAAPNPSPDGLRDTNRKSPVGRVHRLPLGILLVQTNQLRRM